MTSTMTTGTETQASSPGQSNFALLAQIAMRWEAGLVLLVIAIVQQSLGSHNPDNSWLFTVAERYLDGGRIYSDLIETNPPASFLIYVPAIALGRLLHLSAEFMVSAFVFAAALVSLMFALSIARQSNLCRKEDENVLRNAGIFALLTLPGICFAQREHIALIAFIPILIVYAARMKAMPVSLLFALVAGLMAGIGVSIKPHFALVMALPFFIALWRSRTIAIAWKPENIAATLVVATYAVCVLLYFREFITYLPILLDTYLVANVPLLLVMRESSFLSSVLLIVAVLAVAQRNAFNAVSVSTLAGALGFVLAALIQSKGWINHFQPALSLSLFALVVAVLPAIRAHSGVAQRDDVPTETSTSSKTVTSWIAGCVALPAIFLSPMVMSAPHQFAGTEAHPGLRQAVQRLAPKNPKIHAVSIDLDVQFPLVRQLKATWVGRTHILWLMATARYLKQKGRGDPIKMQAYIDSDAQMFATSVRDHKPDVILVPKGTHTDAIKRHPVIATAISGYRKAETILDIDILIPRKK